MNTQDNRVRVYFERNGVTFPFLYERYMNGTLHQWVADTGQTLRVPCNVIYRRIYLIVLNVYNVTQDLITINS